MTVTVKRMSMTALSAVVISILSMCVSVYHS